MSSIADDAEDVNNFLKRIQELGTKRDQEDEERNRKLEEEILQGRKERQARRAERARSISPSKDSPTGTPSHYQGKSSGSPLLTSRPALSPGLDLHRVEQDKDTMDRLTGASSPLKENESPQAVLREDVDTGLGRSGSIRASPSSAIAPSRNSTLSWQQRRPNSRGSDRSRSRPLSMIATENAARSPKATPEPSPENAEHPPASRDQISQMLGSKDPAWFRQTADRGQNSPAYRKNQVEDNNVVDVVSSSRVQLPGMSSDSPRQSGESSQDGFDVDRSKSPSRSRSSNGSASQSSYNGTSITSKTLGSPIPLTSAQRFDPPVSDSTSSSDDRQSTSGRALAMSPSQGRISPERMDRPASPTKGMGGFVQSAMMKRSDSVNKRWSVQSPPGLSRGNSVASNRSSFDTTAVPNLGGVPAREPHLSSLSRGNSPLPSSRPSSSHSNVTIVQENEHPGTMHPTRSSLTPSTTSDGFVKPSLPASRSQIPPDSGNDTKDVPRELHVDSTPPASPSKLANSGRWSPTKSPTKSSWLESALNKPESPKPKSTSQPSQQPAWMAEINKAKQRNADSLRTPPAPKHEVKIGGLIRSPPPGGLAKPLSIGGLPAGFSSGSVARNSGTVTASNKNSGPSLEALQRVTGNKPQPATSPKPSSPSPAFSKSKPDTPPKKDFRANLKPRAIPSENTSAEPEFKNALGQLRRTKTQNYVAPDELKTNILRGKNELTITGGPKKTERKDEFKEAILKKKEDFKKAQADGTGVQRPASGSNQSSAPLPEALAKKAAMGNSTIPARDQDPVGQISSEFRKPSLPKESNTPGRMQDTEAGGSKLADRFNPTLAGILARGPPPTTNETSNSATPILPLRFTRTSTAATNSMPESGPQLTHMTKARARGPRRKAPTAVSDGSGRSTQLGTKPENVLAPPVSKAFEQGSSPIIGSQSTQVVSSVQDESGNQRSQPSSPRKLDMKRRSRFLEEATNKDEKTSQGLDTSPKPLSPKKANSIEIPMSRETEPDVGESKAKVSEPTQFSISKSRQQPNASDPEHTPSSPAKLSTLSRPIQKQPNELSKSIPSSSQQPQQAALPIKPVPSSPDLKKPRPAPLSPSKFKLPNPIKQARDSHDNIDSESVISVKNAAVLFSARSLQLSATIKSPIKLPTKGDEESARIGAGLRSLKTAAEPKDVAPTSRFAKATSTGISTVSSSSPDTGKPLPTPPANGLPSLLPSAELIPTSPRKLQSQSSEASRVLTDFFGKHEFASSLNVDTSTVLSSKLDQSAKIKTLHSQLYQLSGDGKKQPVPNHQERVLFEGNMYLCIHTFGTQMGKKVIEVYFWSGDAVPDSAIEDADLFAKKEARTAGGTLIRLRQGKETSEFIESLGGIMITRRGSSNKYDSLAPHILCGRRFAGQIVFDEVDFAPSSLCSGFPYLVVSQPGKSYLWKGRGSSIDELSCARLIGMDFGITGDVVEIEDGNEPPAFLQIFGPDARIMKSADHWRLKPNYQKYCGRLFCADSSSRSKISEIAPFSQSDISPSNIYILDAFFEIYIIVGARSQSQYTSFCTALLFAQEYGILAAGMEDRPFVPVSTVVLEGVPRDLKFVLRKWRDTLAPTIVHSPNTTLSRGRSLRVVPLNAALDATRF